eukprot:820041-Amphidinium_carterae.1
MGKLSRSGQFSRHGLQHLPFTTFDAALVKLQKSKSLLRVRASLRHEDGHPQWFLQRTHSRK